MPHTWRTRRADFVAGPAVNDSRGRDATGATDWLPSRSSNGSAIVVTGVGVNR